MGARRIYFLNNMEKELYAEMANLETHHWWFLGRRDIILDVLRRFAKKTDGPLLDVGLGTGQNAEVFMKEGFAVEAIESSQDAILYARNKVPKVEILHQSFPEDTVAPDKYSVVTMLDVIEHIEDDAKSLRVATEALKQNGVLILTTPAFSFLWTTHDERAHHKRRYTRSQLRALLKSSGLTPVMISYFNFFLFPAIVLVRILGKIFRSHQGGSDFAKTPSFLNTPLSLLFSSERYLLRLTSLPFGVSLIVVARKV